MGSKLSVVVFVMLLKYVMFENVKNLHRNNTHKRKQKYSQGSDTCLFKYQIIIGNLHTNGAQFHLFYIFKHRETIIIEFHFNHWIKTMVEVIGYKQKIATLAPL